MSEQTDILGFVPNRNRYARLSQPFENSDEATAAITKFNEGLDKLREECGIAEVLAVVGGRYVDSEGEPSDFAMPLQYGDATLSESLAAFLYGWSRARREQIVAGMLKKGGKIP